MAELKLPGFMFIARESPRSDRRGERRREGEKGEGVVVAAATV